MIHILRTTAGYAEGLYRALPQKIQQTISALAKVIFYIPSALLNLEAWVFSNVSSGKSSSEFQRVTRNIPNLQICLPKGSVNADLNSLIFTEIQSRYGGRPEQLAYDALLAYRAEKITLAQFATFTTIYSMLKELTDEEIHSMEIFDEHGEVRPKAKEMIESTLLLKGPRPSTEPYLSQEQLRSYYEELKKAPKSEQHFYYFETEKYTEEVDTEGTMNDSKTISAELVVKGGVSIFHEARIGQKYFRVIPSHTMMQEILRAKAGENAVTITPIIGLSTEEDIRNNGLDATRDMALLFPGVELPKKMGPYALPYTIDAHFLDFYEAFVVNYIPHEHRTAFIHLADIVKRQLKNTLSDTVRQYLSQVYTLLINMRHVLYQNIPGQLRTPQTNFLLSIDSLQTSALTTVITSSQNLQFLFELGSSKVIQQLAEYFANTDLCTTLEITPEVLQQFIGTSTTTLEKTLLLIPFEELRPTALESTRAGDFAFQLYTALEGRK